MSFISWVRVRATCPWSFKGKWCWNFVGQADWELAISFPISIGFGKRDGGSDGRWFQLTKAGGSLRGLCATIRNHPSPSPTPSQPVRVCRFTTVVLICDVRNSHQNNTSAPTTAQPTQWSANQKEQMDGLQETADAMRRCQSSRIHPSIRRVDLGKVSRRSSTCPMRRVCDTQSHGHQYEHRAVW